MKWQTKCASALLSAAEPDQQTRSFFFHNCHRNHYFNTAMASLNLFYPRYHVKGGPYSFILATAPGPYRRKSC